MQLPHQRPAPVQQLLQLLLYSPQDPSASPKTDSASSSPADHSSRQPACDLQGLANSQRSQASASAPSNHLHLYRFVLLLLLLHHLKACRLALQPAGQPSGVSWLLHPLSLAQAICHNLLPQLLQQLLHTLVLAVFRKPHPHRVSACPRDCPCRVSSFQNWLFTQG